MSVSRIWFGLSLVAIAVLFGLESADVLDVSDVLASWWPAFVLGAGVLELLLGRPRQWFGPSLLIAGSALVLGFTTGLLSEVGPLLWAIVLGALGITLLIRASTYRKAAVDTDSVNSLVLFGGREMASHSKRFRGGSVASMFGGTELDLRDAALAPGAQLEVLSAFGGTEIRVPRGWRVEMRGMPIFGAFENATASELELGADAPVLALAGVALFGGIEVKH